MLRRFIHSLSAVSLWLLIASPLQAQVRYRIYGQITDGISKKPLANVSVYDKKQGVGLTTDSLGNFSVQLLPGPYNLTFSAVGYYARSRFLEVGRGIIRLEVALNPDTRQLAEVNVKGRTPDANVSDAQMSVVRLNLKNLRNIPVVFGEVDILKALTLQPGVSTVGEGAGGFNVRGGRTDQNLVLLDGAPLFNTSHLLGLLSNLNADAIQDVTLYKGGIPASYGGRLSSLLLMNTKAAETDRVSITGGIGLLTSRLLAQGPVTKDKKLTFLAGGRIAYPSFVLGLFPAPTNKDRAFFYDLNARLTYRFNVNSQLTATAYRSFDTFKFPQDTLYTTQSTLVTARFSQRFTPNLSVNVTATQSDYRFFLDGLTATNTYRFRSTIRQRDARVDGVYTSSTKNRLEFGGSLTGYQLLPGAIAPTGDFSNIISLTLPTEQAREWAGYMSDEWTPMRMVSIQVGIRYAQFTNVGPGTAYQYAEGQPRTRESITDTLCYGIGQRLAHYGGWEPRATVRVAVTPTSSLKLSYNRTRQYLHLISNTTAISPVDFWKVSDALVPPQVADQFAVGYFQNFQENQFETSIEVYHKTLFLKQVDLYS